MAVLFNMHFSMHLNMNYNIYKIQHRIFCYSQQIFMQTTSVLLLVGDTTLYQILCQIILTLKLQTKSMKSSYWIIIIIITVTLRRNQKRLYLTLLKFFLSN